MADGVAQWQFRTKDFELMREAGILKEDDRVELIDGEVCNMTPIRPIHAAIVRRLTLLLGQMLGGSALVSVQNPVQLDDYSEPQPDLTILRQSSDFYADRHPAPGDVLLVIEVSDTTADYDRSVKMPRYAQAGIAEAWLVDVSNGIVERYTLPRASRYGRMEVYERGQAVEAQPPLHVNLAIDDILG